MNLSIPLDKSPYSYNGLGTGWRNVSESLAPAYSNWMGNYAGNINSAYDSANQGIGSLAKTQLTPAVQSTLNGLAGRGMLNSSVAADALKGTMSNINTQLLNSATNLNASRAGSLADFGKQLLAGGAMGQYSETTNQLAPYELMANLLQGLQ